MMLNSLNSFNFGLCVPYVDIKVDIWKLKLLMDIPNHNKLDGSP